MGDRFISVFYNAPYFYRLLIGHDRNFWKYRRNQETHTWPQPALDVLGHLG